MLMICEISRVSRWTPLRFDTPWTGRRISVTDVVHLPGIVALRSHLLSACGGELAFVLQYI
jgi:hypothetical protein